MTERDYAPLSSACVRGLCDKIYDKRKFAGVEIEKMVKDFSDANNTNQIKRLIRVLGQDLMSSTNPNVKNGALMGLSSVAVGLGKGCVTYVGELTHPIVACLGESEARVRYSAAEALYNVLKIVRGAALPYFTLIFDALARLAADPEPQVKQGAELLDRLVKDIVTESGAVETGALVPLVRERLYTRNASARQFAVSWVCALDAAPALGLRRHLPDLLDPLLAVLDDPNPELRRMCELQLAEFLRTIRKERAHVDFPAMINILITHAQSTEDLLQLTAISWMREFVELSGARMLPYASGILRAVLPALAYHDDARRKIREIAAAVNVQLLKLVEAEAAAAAETVETAEKAEGEEAQEEAAAAGAAAVGLNVDALVEVLTQLMQHSSVHTKIAALDWVLQLCGALPAAMCAQRERVFAAAAAALPDPADDVVRRAIALLAELCLCEPRAAPDLEANAYFHKFVRAVVRLLAADEALLEERGSFVVRQVCVVLPPERVYRALAAALRDERDLRFAARAVDLLSALLLTAPELHATRLRLRAFGPEARALFAALHPCWCHSGAALLALCLLTHNYEHCRRLVAAFADLEVTVELLTEVDKLVQLVESPIFAYLRLELLGGAGSAALRGALYGVLMLLPQGAAFHALRHRLQTAPPPHEPPLLPAPPTAPAAPDSQHMEWDALLEQFRRVQEQHHRYRLAHNKYS